MTHPALNQFLGFVERAKRLLQPSVSPYAVSRFQEFIQQAECFTLPIPTTGRLTKLQAFVDKGNGFASQQITPDTAAVQAISKRYFAGQGDAPVVKDVRPGREGWFRWLTLSEVKAIMGLPSAYELGGTKTLAGEVMGQAVLVDVFTKIIGAVAPQQMSKTG
jgi:hypothetical protein